jgi:hypothetical protein
VESAWGITCPEMGEKHACVCHRGWLGCVTLVCACAHVRGLQGRSGEPELQGQPPVPSCVRRSTPPPASGISLHRLRSAGAAAAVGGCRPKICPGASWSPHPVGDLGSSCSGAWVGAQIELLVEQGRADWESLSEEQTEDIDELVAQLRAEATEGRETAAALLEGVEAARQAGCRAG